MIFIYFLKLKILIMVNKVDISFGLCCFIKNFRVVLECKKSLGRYGMYEKMLECFGNVNS